VTFDEAFVDDRQPAQDLLESDRLAHSVSSPPGTPDAARAGAGFHHFHRRVQKVTAASPRCRYAAELFDLVNMRQRLVLVGWVSLLTTAGAKNGW
jgi:hypothetical protein